LFSSAISWKNKKRKQAGKLAFSKPVLEGGSAIGPGRIGNSSIDVV
jgi:hypothetical protein